MQKLLAALTVVWPLVLGTGWWSRAAEGPHAWTAVVYGAGAYICHQRPERTFHTHGVPWPVCGRCAGLYLAAPLGAAIAMTTRRRFFRGDAFRLVGIAALPTIVTLVLEWTGATPMTSLARALAALPLGAAIAFLIVATADRARS